MPVARQHHTKARRDRARVHHQIKPKDLVTCSNCKAKILPHLVCPKCGFYKGTEVIDTMKKIEKKAKSKK
jgi:large subunit ribosomal protein L32